MDDVTCFKLFSLFTIWGIGLLGGLLPLVIQRRDKRVMSYLNCFGGGIFLAGGFIHLLNGAIENKGLKEWSTRDDGKYAFPYAELFCTLGFLMVFSVEQGAQSLQEVMTHRESDDNEENETFLKSKDENNTSIDIQNNPHHDIPPPIHSHDSFPHSETPSSAVSIVLYIALSFHSILEGLGIGAQVHSAWGIYVAIILHKGLAAFALGSSLLRGKVPACFFVTAMMTFSCMSVLGIVIGWILSDVTAENDATSGICLGLASGTFIYVAVMEVIPTEFSHRVNILGKWTAVLLGYTAFTLLAIWT